MLVLANIDLCNHVTSEGEQLQSGLEAAGWTLAGFGYGDGCVDVPTLLERQQPRIVLVTAREDWDETSTGCFNKHCSFKRIDALASHHDIFKVAVVKDCPGAVDRRKGWCEEIKADAVVIYYHEQSMLKVSPWLKDYRLIRTWHSIDSEFTSNLNLIKPRANGIVTGAVSSAYPLRQLATQRADWFGLDTKKHPGYKPNGPQTQDYLRHLSKYKVHLATASMWGFSLRKIFESVAVGCTPITNLPSYDELPEIDSALIRIPDSIKPESLRAVIDEAVNAWDQQQRLFFASRCWEFYDWRVRGKALSEELRRERPKVSL